MKSYLKDLSWTADQPGGGKEGVVHQQSTKQQKRGRCVVRCAWRVRTVYDYANQSPLANGVPISSVKPRREKKKFVVIRTTCADLTAV